MLISFQVAQESEMVLFILQMMKVRQKEDNVKYAESREVFVWASISVWCVHEHVSPGTIVHIHNMMFNGELGKILRKKKNRSKC